jgi:hypothetical protein
MRLPSFLLIFSLLLSAVNAQLKPAAPPVTFDGLMGVLKNDLIPMATILDGVRNRGIDFDLNQKLAEILAGAAEGHRTPGETATLITASLDSCQKCRARFLAPLTLEELLVLLKKGGDPGALLQEVKVRHVKDLDVSEGTANVLRAGGAKEELVTFLVPDDKIPTIPLIGYNTLVLKHAEDYDPAAPAGWLKVSVEIPANSAGEFVFKHNSLFGRAVSGGEPMNLGAYFNKPAPRNTDLAHLDFTSNLEAGEVSAGDEKHGGFLGIGKGKKDDKAKDIPIIEVAYIGGDADGRNSFQIRLTNKQSSPQQYSFTVRWMELTAPKTPATAPAKPSPAKK